MSGMVSFDLNTRNVLEVSNISLSVYQSLIPIHGADKTIRVQQILILSPSRGTQTVYLQ